MNRPTSSAKLILLFCLSLRSTLSSAATIEQRLELLESEVKTLRDENARLHRDLSAGLAGENARIQPAGSETRLAVGGFLQLQADALDKGDARFTSSNDRFYVRRARFNLAGKLQDRVDFRLELELAGSLSETSGYRAQATDAWIAYEFAPFARLRAGQFKTPFGYEQLSSDLKALSIERSLANDRLTLNRQLGVQLEGTFFDQGLTYATGVFNGTGINTNVNDNDAFLWAGRISTKVLQAMLAGRKASLTTGVGAYTSRDSNLANQPPEFLFDSVAGGTRDNLFSGSRSGLGLDAQLKLGAFDLWAEYLRTRYEPSNAIPYAVFDCEGWYLQAACFITPKKLQAVLKFESFDSNRATAGNSTDTWTTGLNWLLKGDDLKLMADYLLTDPAGFPDHRQKILVRLQTIF